MADWEYLMDQVFKGPRFEDGSLDVEAMSELKAYRALVVEVAKEIWRRDHQERERLPRNFEDRFQLRCSKIDKGSSVATLLRSRSEMPLPAVSNADEFDRAIALIDDAIVAANNEEPPPSQFPRSAMRLFRSWGRNLGPDESLQLRSQARAVAPVYRPQTRERLLEFIDIAYEDEAELTGHVLATTVRKGRFELYPDLESSFGVDVPLEQAHEQTVLNALAGYTDVQLRVKGRAAFSTDGRISRFVEVESVEVWQSSEADNAALWSAIYDIVRSVPSEAWNQVPEDASVNLDAYTDAS